MKHCIIEYADYSGILNVVEYSNNIEYLEIRYCSHFGIVTCYGSIKNLYIHHCEYGIKYLGKYEHHSEIIIENCDVGIIVQRGFLSKAIIRNNNIGISTIYLRENYINPPPILEDVTIANNVDHGIHYLYTNTTSDHIIKNCTFENNGTAISKIGDRISQSQHLNNKLIFEKNIISNNTLDGVKIVLSSQDLNNVSIKNNDFTGNGGFAFDMEAQYISGCEIYLDNNYLVDNNGLLGVDLSTDGSGGQYMIDPFSMVVEFTNPRSVPNVSIGATWGGF